MSVSLMQELTPVTEHIQLNHLSNAFYVFQRVFKQSTALEMFTLILFYYNTYFFLKTNTDRKWM